MHLFPRLGIKEVTKFFEWLVVIFLVVDFDICIAASLNCPAEEQIKAAQLIQAKVSPYDPECWNFNSLPFRHQNREWIVQFGSFFQDLKSSSDALIKGQRFFASAKLLIKQPIPVAIPKSILCDYMPEGREYWVSAVSPEH